MFPPIAPLIGVVNIDHFVDNQGCFPPLFILYGVWEVETFRVSCMLFLTSKRSFHIECTSRFKV